MFSIVPVLDELVGTHHQPFLRNISLVDDFRNQLGFSNEIKTIEDTNKQLTLAVNCESFKPEQVKVKVENGFVEISGDLEEKTENSYVKRQFRRKFLLPSNAIQEKINCQMTQNGVLKVTIPKQPKTIEGSGSVNIPIQFSK